MNLKFGEIKIDKKEFHKSKKPVDLNLTDTNKTVISDRLKLDEGDKYYFGYKNSEFVGHYALSTSFDLLNILMVTEKTSHS